MVSEIDQAEDQNIEIRLLLEAIFLKYGYDFRDYSPAHIKRRIMQRLVLTGIRDIAEMQRRVLNDSSFFEKLLLDLSINVTEMFRDPSVFRAIREEVVPLLHTYPFVKIWVAGCASGEEVYSLAILLREEGLYKKTQIYATDFNQAVLKKAKDGIYAINHIKKYTSNYQKAGGQASLADYYTAKYSSVIFDQALKEKIVFADHNLVTDTVFGEMNMIMCRNVLIYFNKILQNRVVKLFSDSLCPGGFLCLGTKESLKFSQYWQNFESVCEKEKIFRKKYS